MAYGFQQQLDRLASLLSGSTFGGFPLETTTATGLICKNYIFSDDDTAWYRQGGKQAFGYAWPYTELVGHDGFSVSVAGNRLNVSDAIQGARIRAGTLTLSNVTETVLLTVDAFSYIHLCGYSISNRNLTTPVTVDIRSKPSGAGTSIWPIYVPANQHVSGNLGRPGRRASANEDISVKLSDNVTDVLINLVGYADGD